MKKLEKLRLHNLEKISVAEQKVLKGGGEWVIGPDGNYYWYVGDIEITGYIEPADGWAANCPRCQQNMDFGMVNNPNYSSENESLLKTVFKFLGNTIPHMLGIGGHVNGQDTWQIFPVEEIKPDPNYINQELDY
jgi:hypothetical protein